MTLFNFTIGNGDAHRKNFSLLTTDEGTVALSPCYDIVSSRLAELLALRGTFRELIEASLLGTARRKRLLEILADWLERPE